MVVLPGRHSSAHPSNESEQHIHTLVDTALAETSVKAAHVKPVDACHSARRQHRLPLTVAAVSTGPLTYVSIYTGRHTPSAQQKPQVCRNESHNCIWSPDDWHWLVIPASTIIILSADHAEQTDGTAHTHVVKLNECRSWFKQKSWAQYRKGACSQQQGMLRYITV